MFRTQRNHLIIKFIQQQQKLLNIAYFHLILSNKKCYYKVSRKVLKEA